MNVSGVLPFEKRTVFDGQGRGDLGFVTDAIALAINCSAGAIRLLNGAKAGFGLAHIESHASRVKQIEGLGFRDVFAYVRFIASDFEAIAVQADGRLVFLREHQNMTHWLICQWDAELTIWSVTTTIPKPTRRGLNVVWERK